jgi:hypothetical protein
MVMNKTVLMLSNLMVGSLVLAVLSQLAVRPVAAIGTNGRAAKQVNSASAQTNDVISRTENLKEAMKEVTDELDPKYVYSSEGYYEVKLGADVSFRLPNGLIIDPDGAMTFLDGTKFKAVMKDGNFIGIQYYRTDGSPAQPGEVLTLPNNQTVQQSSF